MRGAYAVYVLGEDPAKQAAHFLATTRLDGGDLPPAVDVETRGKSADGKGPSIEDLRRYLNAVEAGTGVKPIVSTSPAFWNANFDDSFGAYPLWVVDAGTEEPPAASGWDGWTFWQHSPAGTVDGVAGTVGLDSFAESESSLKGLTLP